MVDPDLVDAEIRFYLGALKYFRMMVRDCEVALKRLSREHNRVIKLEE